MGNFYTSITLRGPDQDSVLQLLNQQRRRAYVSPTVNGTTVVCDEECESQDIDVLESLASGLSTHLGCAALAILNHDDDILVYKLYDRGKLVDQYDSSPEYFDPQSEPSSPVGGDVDQLLRLMGRDRNNPEVEGILRKSSYEEGGYVFAIQRHEDLVRALGLPLFSVGMGYNYLEEDEIPEGLDEGALKHTESDR